MKEPKVKSIETIKNDVATCNQLLHDLGYAGHMLYFEGFEGDKIWLSHVVDRTLSNQQHKTIFEFKVVGGKIIYMKNSKLTEDSY